MDEEKDMWYRPSGSRVVGLRCCWTVSFVSLQLTFCPRRGVKVNSTFFNNALPRGKITRRKAIKVACVEVRTEPLQDQHDARV